MRRRPANSLLVSVLSLLVLLSAGGTVSAHWLTKLVKEAGEAGVDAGSTAGRIGIGALDDATAVLRRLPKPKKGELAFAAHATPDGHWKFTNQDGGVFTAATPDEMGRVAKALAPDADANAPLNIYLSDETLFKRANSIDDLPKSARLNVVSGGKAFTLVRRGGGTGMAKYFAKVRPNVLVRIGEKARFEEAVWQMGRKLPQGDVRVLSLKPGGRASLAPAAKIDKARGGVPLADEIDPGRLAEALPGIRGQTALLTGRIEGDLLYALPSSGAEQVVSLSGVRAAAAKADVNLVVLHSARPLQPGGQNWLWQTIEVDGLKSALKKPAFADFLEALAGSRGQLVVSSTPQGAGRVLVEAIPDASKRDIVDSVGNWVGDAVSEVAGNVVTESVSAFMTSKQRQKELDDRIVPGIPSDFQFYYLGAIVMGLIGFGVARSWWERIWPGEERGEYRGAFGFWAARAVRWAMFLLVFLPIVGPIALLGALALKIFGWLMVPVRLVQRLLGFSGA